MQYHVYNKDLMVGSLQSHCCTVNILDGSSSILVEQQAVPAPRTHKFSFVQLSRYRCQTVPCPVNRCPYQAHEATFLHQHFFNYYPTSYLHLEDDEKIPCFCLLCGVLVLLVPVQQAHVGSNSSKTNIHRTR